MSRHRPDRRQQRRDEAAARLAASKRRLCGHMHVPGGVDRCRKAYAIVPRFA